jgi:hypothetical protein
MEHEESTEKIQLSKPMTVYKPLSSDRVLDYSTSGKMKYRERESKEKSGLPHCTHIKMLVNDVDFLTEKARQVEHTSNNPTLCTMHLSVAQICLHPSTTLAGWETLWCMWEAP